MECDQNMWYPVNGKKNTEVGGCDDEKIQDAFHSGFAFLPFLASPDRLPAGAKAVRPQLSIL